MEHTPVRCAACDRDMKDSKTGTTYVGLAFQYGMLSDPDGAFARVYPDLTPGSISICYVCWLKANGVPASKL